MTHGHMGQLGGLVAKEGFPIQQPKFGAPQSNPNHQLRVTKFNVPFLGDPPPNKQNIQGPTHNKQRWLSALPSTGYLQKRQNHMSLDGSSSLVSSRQAAMPGSESLRLGR